MQQSLCHADEISDDLAEALFAPLLLSHPRLAGRFFAGEGGILCLSERYGWFPFNANKGWTVLIAVAAVGAVLIVMLLWFAVALVFRWRYQFTIRTLLVLTISYNSSAKPKSSRYQVPLRQNLEVPP